MVSCFEKSKWKSKLFYFFHFEQGRDFGDLEFWKVKSEKTFLFSALPFDNTENEKLNPLISMSIEAKQTTAVQYFSLKPVSLWNYITMFLLHKQYIFFGLDVSGYHFMNLESEDSVWLQYPPSKFY